MQESHQTVIAIRAPTVVGLSIVDPSLRFELVGIWTPELRISVHGPRADDDFGSTWDGMAREVRVSNCDTNGDGYGGI